MQGFLRIETQDHSSTETLFLEYLNTLNQALDAHREEAPYKQLIDLGQKLMDDKKIGIAIYKSDPSSPHDFYTVKFTDGRLAFVSHGKEAPDHSWKVKESFMQDVVKDKQTYIQNPAKLDWDWLRSRLGI